MPSTTAFIAPLDDLTRCSSKIPTINATHCDYKMYYYNEVTNRCRFVNHCGHHHEDKYYFTDLETCENICIDQERILKELDVQQKEDIAVIEDTDPIINKCQLDMQPGNCQFYFNRHFYDYKTNQCKTFIYTGCGGNENNFKTIADCQKDCVTDSFSFIPEVDDITDATFNELEKANEEMSDQFTEFARICNQTLDRGTCDTSNGERLAYSIRFYWDNSERRCKPFRYLGCGGNENKFKTLHGCENTCGTLKNVEPFNARCLYHHEAGPCEAAITRWRWDVNRNECVQFKWTGCMLDGSTFNGDRNNFMNKNDCQCHCVNADKCISKCQMHETYHFSFTGMDDDEKTTYKSIVCRNLNSTIGDLVDLVKEHTDIEFLDIRNNELNADDMEVLKYVLEMLPLLRVALLGGNQLYGSCGYF